MNLTFKKQNLQFIIEKYKPRTLFYFLAFIFFIIYVSQISLWTTIADVLVYASRAMSDTPIIKYAFLGTDTQTLPNYHLAHTVLGWLAYQIVPESLASTIWPIGFISATCGAFVVGLSFLIWLHLRIRQYAAFIIAIIGGLIPSIWYNSLIGEVYALQLLFILLTLYFFLRDNLLLTAVSFLVANLVSPISALSFSMLFLKSPTRNTLFRMFLVGIFSLSAYILIFYIIDSNILITFQALKSVSKEGSTTLTWKAFHLTLIFLLNFNFFIIFLLHGVRIVWEEHRSLVYGLIIAIIPQLFLVSLGPEFLMEWGSLLLPLFWILCLPAGLAMAKVKNSKYLVIFAMVGSIALTQILWIYPRKQKGKARHEAGIQLRSMVLEEIKIAGDWETSIGVLIGRYGWDLEKVAGKYIPMYYPSGEQLLKTGENSLIVAINKKPGWRIKLNKILMLKDYFVDYIEKIKDGSIKLLFENNAVYLYRWDRS
jgi:hypothetical protein